MQPFSRHTGLVAVLNRDDVDTDQIMPKQHLKRVERTGFGELLFSSWRYLEGKTPNPDFELNRLDAERRMAEARYRTAKSQYDRTVLRAPFAGSVDIRFLDLGDYASPMAPFVRFLDLAEIRVEVPVPEVYLGKVSVGDAADVFADPYPGRAFAGEVTFVSREVDRDTRTVTVEVSVPNEDGALGPGMTLRVRLVRRLWTHLPAPSDRH